MEPRTSILGESWIGNRLGVDENVPDPWTPLALHGDRVVLWNGVYNFAGSPAASAGAESGEDLGRVQDTLSVAVPGRRCRIVAVAAE
ncbi:MAG: hypothetical protein HY321_10440 [Armatimonadetes bacterium]|nr:hypothetical protein [Armatimonadota bacterium]